MPRCPSKIYRGLVTAPVTTSVALLLGAGFSVAGGLPATGGLMDGQMWVVSGEQSRRVQQVLSSWETWRARHGDDVAGFLHSTYLGHVESAAVGTLPGAKLPWPWVTQYLAARLSEHTTGARGGSSPRNFERLTTPSGVGPHRQLLQELAASGPLIGVVTSNYDLLAERVLRPRAVRGWPTVGFHYAGLPRPQIAQGTPLPWRQRDGTRHAAIELTGEVPLAKLHGSLNWDRQGATGGASGPPVNLWQDLRRSYRLDAAPAIVAPIPETTPPSWLEPVWHAAARLLRTAEQWVVVGYSLPEYDVAIRNLLVDAGHGQRIVVRDPMAATVAERFRSLLPTSEVAAGSAL
jgi:hypothetical protein